MQELNKQLYLIASLIENGSNDKCSVSLANKIRMKIRNNPTSAHDRLKDLIPDHVNYITGRSLTAEQVLNMFGLESQYRDAIATLFDRSDIFYSVLDKIVSLLEFV